MARQRLIRPDFFTDERLAARRPHARLLFAGLWGLADKRGRLRDQPPVIHGAVFPFEPDLAIGSLLDELQDAGSILRYVVDSKKYIQVKNFERYQKPHPKEAESTIPEPPPLYRAEPRKDTAEPLLSTDEPGGIRSFVPSVPVGRTVPGDPRLPPSVPPNDEGTEPPTLPPADRAERAIRLSTEALRTKLYGLIDALAREDPEHADPTELIRMVTGYAKPDGTQVKGVVNAALLTHERLEKSIADAEAQLAEWREAKARASPTPSRAAVQQP
jgi:hypothetical protein